MIRNYKSLCCIRLQNTPNLKSVQVDLISKIFHFDLLLLVFISLYYFCLVKYGRLELDPLLCAMSLVKFRPHFICCKLAMLLQKDWMAKMKTLFPLVKTTWERIPSRTLRITYVVTSRSIIFSSFLCNFGIPNAP
jgi:hypothetical protein